MASPTDLLAGLLPFVLLAFAASLHCMGMCGGFTAALAAQGHGLSRASWFSLGKALTYAVLGLALGLVATPARAELGELRAWLAWFAGGALIVLGLARLGLPLPAAPARWWHAAGAPLRRAYGQVARLPGYAGPLGAGLVAGTLPCGVSWGALALALTRAPLEAALGMFLFGLATAPALLATAFGWARFEGRVGASCARLLGPLLIGLGLWTGLRGGLPGGGGERVLLPACCTDAAIGP